MIRNFLSILATIFLFLLPNIGYTQFCGTRLTSAPTFDANAFRAFQQRQTTSRNQKMRHIALTFHIVEEVRGASNIDITKLYEEVDAINRFFTGAGLQFFICGSPRIIAGKDLYTYQQAANDLNRPKHVPNTINIFYLDEIGDQISSSACGISTFPFDLPASARFIIMQKSCSTNGSVLAHEIGHFFGLLHTHETYRGAELVDRSNCDRAGDFVCDTPADPNLGNVGLNGCSYEGNYKDANGDLYNPDPSNIMSYAPPRCAIRFSKEQNDRMNFYLETTDLADLLDNCDFYPDFAIASEETNNSVSTTGQLLDLTYQFSNEGIAEETNVDISFILEPVDGGTSFTIHKDQIVIRPAGENFEATFSVEVPLFISTGTYTLTAALDPNSLIQERDKRNNFHDLTIIVDNSSLADNLLFPNPVRDQVKVFLRDNNNSGDLTVSITDYLGRTYLTQENYKGEDELFLKLDAAHLSAGLYILTIEYKRNNNRQSFVLYKE